MWEDVLTLYHFTHQCMHAHAHARLRRQTCLYEASCAQRFDASGSSHAFLLQCNATWCILGQAPLPAGPAHWREVCMWTAAVQYLPHLSQMVLRCLLPAQDTSPTCDAADMPGGCSRAPTATSAPRLRHAPLRSVLGPPMMRGQPGQAGEQAHVEQAQAQAHNNHG